jgi:hypothetical protein
MTISRKVLMVLPVIVTDVANGQVLMLAYMNEESYKLTLKRVKLGIGPVPVKNCGTRARHLVIINTSKKSQQTVIWIRC